LTYGIAWGVEPTDLRFLEGLRQRRLFELASDFCQQQLADPQLSDADRATLTIEFARCRAGQALNAAPREREPLWQEATKLLNDFVARYPNHPRRFLVQVQEALLLLARGELARQEAEVGAESEQARSTAREQIRLAARRLEDLEKELQRAIPGRGNARPGEEDLSSEQLASLLDDVRYQLARAYRNQALTYPAGSADRVNSLMQAVQRLGEVRRSVGEADPLYWPCRVDWLTCHRLLEKMSEAAQQLSEIESSKAPPKTRVEAAAERIRLLLATGRAEQAIQTISQGRMIQGVGSPELDLAHLEAFIALWKSTEAKSEANSAASWRGKAVAMTQKIEELHGPYWRRRADALLTGSAIGAATAGDLEILVRTARDHYLRKRWDEAVQAYDEAARQAQAAGDAPKAFELFYQAAAIEHERQNHVEAARRFRTLATAMPQHSTAAETHLLACFNLAQWARTDPTQLESYASALEEHLSLWPDEANQARLWLGKLRESQKRWDDAVAAYRGVTATHSDYETAVAGAARAWARLRESSEEPSKDRANQREDALRFFERIVFETTSEATATQVAAARTAALAAARLGLQDQTGDQANAERILKKALNLAPDAPAVWRTQVRGLLVLALAGQANRTEEAKAMLRDLASESPNELAALIENLATQMRASSPAARAQQAGLALQAIDLLGGAVSQLSPEDQLLVQRARAESLATTGRIKEAKDLYGELTRRHPQDVAIQVGYGELLLNATDAATRDAALRQWRLIAQRSRPRTELWWRAKYNVALLQFRAGEREQAAQLIRYLKEIPPGLENSPLQAEFLALLKQCE
jgi:tetratricopeptide (TPR) repeat protein